jgi:hypothetical protein
LRAQIEREREVLFGSSGKGTEGGCRSGFKGKKIVRGRREGGRGRREGWGGGGVVVEIFESSAGISSDPGSSIHQLAKLSTFSKITNFLFKAKMLNLIFKSYLFSSPLLSFDHHSTLLHL